MPREHPTQRQAEISWRGWGGPERAAALPEDLRGLLSTALGVRRPGAVVPAMGELALAESRLPAGVVDRLAAVVGAGYVLSGREARLRHLRGKSTLDLLRLRRGETGGAPDAVVLPATHDEVQALLEVCSAERVAVVPFGGGTSVVGGLEVDRPGFTGVVAVDTRRLDALLELDEESRTAWLEPGLRGPEAEALLGRHGYTLGHFPQSFQYATLGGFAATRSSGQASSGYGRFDELVLGLRAATPAGGLELGRAPRSAAGPDLRQLVLGSEGAFGLITALRLALRPVPERRLYEGWRFNGFWEGVQAMRRLAQDGPRPTVLRLSDEAETALGPGGGGALMICGVEGRESEVPARAEELRQVLRSAGGEFVEGAGEVWEQGRYEAPYLRDALLDAGALAETLETACFWSALGTLYREVGDALRESLQAQGTPAAVLCHVSHTYPAGASLYFTVGCAMADDPVAQWQRAKAAAGEAILRAGGTISHHHGVGRDHAELLRGEIGELGVAALDAVKRELDPVGIMNPGVLLPRRAARSASLGAPTA